MACRLHVTVVLLCLVVVIRRVCFLFNNSIDLPSDVVELCLGSAEVVVHGQALLNRFV